ncbi:MAG: hypothetical protein IJG13_25005 [Kiritimatiellae bacterium]|nr:hypothetical protein [Kiritimatiellia bacterium]MBQ3343898.1 hypothetical protein [Kiritimatiellia bacterium]
MGNPTEKIKAQIEKFQKGLDAFMENEYWRDLYKSAPVGAKRWLEGEFAASESEDEPPDGPDPDMPMIMEGMKKEDWLWLAEYDCFHPKQKEYFLRMAASDRVGK